MPTYTDSFTYTLQLLDTTHSYNHISIHIHSLSGADVYSLTHISAANTRHDSFIDPYTPTYPHIHKLQCRRIPTHSHVHCNYQPRLIHTLLIHISTATNRHDSSIHPYIHTYPSINSLPCRRILTHSHGERERTYRAIYIYIYISLYEIYIYISITIYIHRALCVLSRSLSRTHTHTHTHR